MINENASWNKLKSMNRNQATCPHCGIRLFIPPEIARENYIQCLTCYNTFPNPLKRYNNQIYNTPNQNSLTTNCPRCGIILHGPPGIIHEDYVQCLSCYHTFPNPLKKSYSHTHSPPSTNLTKRNMSGYNTRGKYVEFWTRNLDLIESKILNVQNTQEEQTIEFKISDLEILGNRKKSGYSFSLEYRNGSLQNVISNSAVARDLAIVLENSKEFKTLSAGWFKLSFQDTGKMIISGTPAIKNSITLRAAIEKVLEQTGRKMTTQEIADVLNENKWYQNEDASQIKASQIESRVKNYTFVRFENNEVTSIRKEIEKQVKWTSFWEGIGPKIIGGIIGVVVVLFFIFNDKSSCSVDSDTYVKAAVRMYLQNTLKDPGSYKPIEWGTVIEQNGAYKYIIWHKYRAKNSYGGYVVEEHYFYLDGNYNVRDVY